MDLLKKKKKVGKKSVAKKAFSRTRFGARTSNITKYGTDYKSKTAGKTASKAKGKPAPPSKGKAKKGK